MRMHDGAMVSIKGQARIGTMSSIEARHDPLLPIMPGYPEGRLLWTLMQHTMQQTLFLSLLHHFDICTYASYSTWARSQYATFSKNPPTCRRTECERGE